MNDIRKSISDTWFQDSCPKQSKKHIILSQPHIPPLTLTTISREIHPQHQTYTHPHRHNRQRKAKEKQKNKQQFRRKKHKKSTIHFPLSHRTNPPNYFNFKQAKINTDRVHPDYIVLDDERQILYHSLLNTWTEQYQSEDYGFNSSLLYCKVRLFELLNATSREVSPCKTRISVICDLFNKLCESPRFSQALQPFKNELMQAIYVKYNEQSFSSNNNTNTICHRSSTQTNLEFFKMETYFECYQTLKSKHTETNKKLKLLEARLQSKSEISAEADGSVKLIDYILSMWRFDRMRNAFRAWKCYIQRKKQRLIEIFGKFRAFQISKRKIFIRWRFQAQTTKKERTQLDIFRFRKHISVIENNLQFYKLRYDDVRKSSSEHIERLLNDVSGWRMKALQSSNDMDEEFSNVPAKLLNKWKLYFCDYFKKLLDLCKERIDHVCQSGSYYDPCIIMKAMTKLDDSQPYTKFQDINQIETMSSEDVVLNWINFRLMPFNLQVTNFSLDFNSCKIYFTLLNEFRGELFDIKSCLEENSIILRAEKVIDILCSIGANEGPLIHAHDIIDGKADLNFVMIVRLMLLFPGISVRKSVFEKEYEILKKIMIRCGKLRRSRKVRDIKKLDAFATECYTMMEKVDKAIGTMRLQHTMWVDACSKIASGAQIYVTSRMRDKPRTVNDEIQKAVKKEFGHISSIKLSDILKKYHHPNTELELLRKILQNTTDEIQHIFTYYAAGGKDKDMINLTEFSTFVTDVRVKGRGLPKSQIKKIFEIANLEESDMNVDLIINDDDMEDEYEEENEAASNAEDADHIKFELFGENPDDTLVGHEFIECLVRIAHKKFHKNASTLAEAYEMLLNQHLRRYACHSNKFRDLIKSPLMQKIFQGFSTNLKKIFICYSKLSFKRLSLTIEANAGINQLGLRVQEFVSMLKDCRLVGNAMPQSAIESILAKIHKDEKGLFNYANYCEGLAAVSCLQNPDPYVPLKAKITIFIGIHIIHPLIKGQLIKNSIKR